MQEEFNKIKFTLLKLLGYQHQNFVVALQKVNSLKSGRQAILVFITLFGNQPMQGQ